MTTKISIKRKPSTMMKRWRPKPAFQGRYERSIAEMYDADDLSACSLFAGNFINFGFWKNSKFKKNLTLEDRIESERALYRYVAKTLEISNRDRILEVACGQGVGSALILKEFKPKEILGIDISRAQIQRARKNNALQLKKNIKKISFREGKAEEIPCLSATFDRIFSIEAAQHFSNLKKFAEEAYRVLKSQGKLAVATFFGTSAKSKELLSDMIQTVADGIDKLTPINEFKDILIAAGFKNIKIKSIGKNVWQGFDCWTSFQTEFKQSWTRNWLKGYKDHLLDYFLITADKID